MSKVAFVTGAGGYLGSEVALHLAKEGFSVAVCDINAESIERTLARIAEIGGEAKGYIADVSESQSIDAAMNKAYDELGGLDAMVHVAGGSARIAGEYHRIVNQDDYVIDRVIKVNLYGAIYSSRAAARLMIKQGRGGKIINFSSTVGVNGLKSCAEYAAAKGGVMSFTKALAKELGEYGINVNSVAPGVVCRPEVDTSTEKGKKYAYDTNFLGEKCTANDVANLVEFLVSDKSGFITGQTYIIDGGRSLAMKGTD